jgi:NAD(P)-dependent dehydrogenase (short-subunit alcohol dehydrogenase family)
MSKKTWFITGCSTGFGRALAEQLLARGEHVTATARKPESLAPLVAEYGENVLALKLDVTRPEDIDAAIGAAEQRFGDINVLVNNAGYGQVGVVEDQPIEIARGLMETHFFAVVTAVKAVLPEMRRRRAGQIVNIGSVAGQIGFPSISYYCASKFALAGFTESLAAELRPLGIYVTLAELGPFATDFTRSLSFAPPSTPDYDMAALSQTAGNSHWGAGHDTNAGVAALLAALDHPTPPVHLILGPLGIEVVERHEARRREERELWMKTTMLEPDDF